MRHALRVIATLIGAALVATTCAVASASPAGAATGALFWDDEGSTFREFGPNEAVNIAFGEIQFRCDAFFPTADVYIVDDFVPPASASTLVDAGGAANTVFGGTGGFFSDTIGFTQPAGQLKTGFYSVVYDECQDGKFDPSIDEFFPMVFEVSIPANVPLLPSAEIQAIKASSAARATVAQNMRYGLELLLAMEDYEKVLTCLLGPIACGASWGVDYVKNLVVDKFKEEFAWNLLPIFTEPPWEKVKDFAKDAAKDSYQHWDALANDPPDPQFEQATVLSRTVPELDGTLDDPLLIAEAVIGNATANENATIVGLVHALERYQGAQGAGDGDWALAHARQTASLASSLADELLVTDAGWDALRAALAADPRDFDGAASAIDAERERLLADGLTPEQYQLLTNFGFGEAEIADLFGFIDALGPTGFTRAGVLAAIDDLRASTASTIAALDDLADGMLAIETTLLADPNVGGTGPDVDAGGPYSATEGVPVVLSGSSSTDPTGTSSVYSWDLDLDGDFDDSTGRTPTTTFSSARDGLIGLRVTDATGVSATDYTTVHIADSDLRPTLLSTAPAVDDVFVTVGTTEVFSVTASDPESGPLATSWLLEGVPSGSASSFAFTPSAADLGSHRLVVTVSDGQTNGGSTQRWWTVHVLFPDGDGDGWNSNTDCNDAVDTVHPAATELLGNGVDDDCDPLTNDLGVDGDGDGSPSTLDCNDGDALVNPGAPEVRGDLTDNDCDPGTTDELLGQAVILRWDSSGWRYKSGLAADAEPGFEAPAYDDSGFSAGSAPFGSDTGCSPSPPQSPWPVSTDIVARSVIDLAPGTTGLKVHVAFDNAVQVFVNGTDVSGGLVNRESCSGHANAIWTVPDGLLLDGPNVLALRGRDYGGVSFLDVLVVATVPNGVPVQPDQLVNATGDRPDMVIDGACDTGYLNTVDAPECTLRAAIQEANSNGDASDIRFGIPGSGPHAIQVATSLPVITTPVVIDGTTQAASSCPDDHMVEVTSNTGARGFVLVSPEGGTVRGLSITGMNEAIHFGQGPNRAECNYIGLRPDGVTVKGNANGIVLQNSGATGNVIGGPASWQRNVISGNSGNGVWFINGANGNVVQGNYIGTDASGTTAKPNTGSGVSGFDSYNTIGGITLQPGQAPGNIISGNNGTGITDGRGGVHVLGNAIGVNVNGAPLGNGGSGVVIFFNGSGTIGGIAPGSGNRIAHNAANGGHGIDGVPNSFAGASRATVRGNSIVNNANKGISWGAGTNDDGDPDGGSNQLQNFPVPASAEAVVGGTRVTGSLNSTPSTTFALDFYANAACDSTGRGEGDVYLGSATTTTNGSNLAQFDVTIPLSAPVGWVLTSTATSPAGHTSEFSECVPITGATFPVSVSATPALLSSAAWTTDLSVSPDSWNLFNGDTGASEFILTATMGAEQTVGVIDGEVCVTNPTASPLPGLSIAVTAAGASTPGTPLASTPVDTSDQPALDAGDGHCYAYHLELSPTDSTAGAALVVAAAVLSGADDSHASTDADLPQAPTQGDDTLAASVRDGDEELTFEETGSRTFTRTYRCGRDEGVNTTLVDVSDGTVLTGDVTVACNALQVTHAPVTSGDTSYVWSITKSGSRSDLDLVTGETASVDYEVVVDASGIGNVVVSDDLVIHNPASIPATLTSVGLVSSGIGPFTVDCPGVTFPHVLPPNGDLACTGAGATPDGTPRVFTAAALRQALHHDADLTTTASGASLTIQSAESTSGTNGSQDTCASVTDSLQGALGTLCVGADQLPATFTYARQIGPYTTAGPRDVENTATVTAADSAATDSASWTVHVDVTAPPIGDGCTVSVGFWKNHAGAKKQSDLVSPLLPIWLGTASGAASLEVTSASQARSILGYETASNGIQKVQSQLLGAKLNVASGAAPTPIATTIADVDAFLAATAASDWRTLSKSQQGIVNDWAATLASYNLGLLGVPHCA